ncbi:MAG TPA: DNA-processing protein DprA, partial [Solirubrobacteraceae bacterium]|nr:DNA-processing protein DprA [Solirubrobacteraceae bacterium]
VGAARPSEYGTEIARALAGALAARGVTVAAEIAPGIALAAHEGSLRAGGAPLALVAEDLERRSPAWCGPLYREILERGCALSALQADGCVGKAPRPGTASVLAPLADLVVLVEASARGPELAYARACRKCGVALAAVPGRVDAPTSHGTNTLIAAGAPVLCGVQDALDAIYSPNADRADRTPQAERARRAPRRRDAGRTGALAPSRTSAPTAGPVALDLEHSRLLERVVLGADTLDALCAEGEFEPEALELGLTELELLGVLRRGVGGRYLPCAEVAIG